MFPKQPTSPTQPPGPQSAQDPGSDSVFSDSWPGTESDPNNLAADRPILLEREMHVEFPIGPQEGQPPHADPPVLDIPFVAPPEFSDPDAIAAFPASISNHVPSVVMNVQASPSQPAESTVTSNPNPASVPNPAFSNSSDIMTSDPAATPLPQDVTDAGGLTQTSQIVSNTKGQVSTEPVQEQKQLADDPYSKPLVEGNSTPPSPGVLVESNDSSPSDSTTGSVPVQGKSGEGTTAVPQSSTVQSAVEVPIPQTVQPSTPDPFPSQIKSDDPFSNPKSISQATGDSASWISNQDNDVPTNDLPSNGISAIDLNTGNAPLKSSGEPVETQTVPIVNAEPKTPIQTTNPVSGWLELMSPLMWLLLLVPILLLVGLRRLLVGNRRIKPIVDQDTARGRFGKSIRFAGEEYLLDDEMGFAGDTESFSGFDSVKVTDSLELENLDSNSGDAFDETEEDQRTTPILGDSSVVNQNLKMDFDFAEEDSRTGKGLPESESSPFEESLAGSGNFRLDEDSDNDAFGSFFDEDDATDTVPAAESDAKGIADPPDDENRHRKLSLDGLEFDEVRESDGPTWQPDSDHDESHAQIAETETTLAIDEAHSEIHADTHADETSVLAESHSAPEKSTIESATAVAPQSKGGLLAKITGIFRKRKPDVVSTASLAASSIAPITTAIGDLTNDAGREGNVEVDTDGEILSDTIETLRAESFSADADDDFDLDKFGDEGDGETFATIGFDNAEVKSLNEEDEVLQEAESEVTPEGISDFHVDTETARDPENQEPGNRNKNSDLADTFVSSIAGTTPARETVSADLRNDLTSNFEQVPSRESELVAELEEMRSEKYRVAQLLASKEQELESFTQQQKQQLEEFQLEQLLQSEVDQQHESERLAMAGQLEVALADKQELASRLEAREAEIGAAQEQNMEADQKRESARLAMEDQLKAALADKQELASRLEAREAEIGAAQEQNMEADQKRESARLAMEDQLKAAFADKQELASRLEAREAGISAEQEQQMEADQQRESEQMAMAGQLEAALADKQELASRLEAREAEISAEQERQMEADQKRESEQLAMAGQLEAAFADKQELASRLEAREAGIIAEQEQHMEADQKRESARLAMEGQLEAALADKQELASRLEAREAEFTAEQEQHMEADQKRESEQMAMAGQLEAAFADKQESENRRAEREQQILAEQQSKSTANQSKIDELATQLRSSEDELVEKSLELESLQFELATAQLELASRSAAGVLASTTSLASTAADKNDVGKTIKKSDSRPGKKSVDRATREKFTKLFRAYERERRQRKATEKWVEEAEEQRDQIRATLISLQSEITAIKAQPNESTVVKEKATMAQEAMKSVQSLQAETQRKLSQTLSEVEQRIEQLSQIELRLAESEAGLKDAESRRSIDAAKQLAIEKELAETKAKLVAAERKAQKVAELPGQVEMLTHNADQASILTSNLDGSTSGPEEEIRTEFAGTKTTKFLPSGTPSRVAKTSLRASLPENSGVDDLTLIPGIGNVVARKLQAAGVVTFAQVAAWSKADVAHFERRLGLKNRIVQFDWIGQARKLTEERQS